MKSWWVLAAFVLGLSGCGIKVEPSDQPLPPPFGPGGSGQNGGIPDASKPSPSDLSGTPAQFSGQWQGLCTYTYPSQAKSSSCSVSLMVSQSGSLISGYFTYQVDQTSGHVQLMTYSISGNNLQSAAGQTAGYIGSGAVEFADSQLQMLSLKVTGFAQANLVVQQLPNLAGGDLIATLNRQN